MNQRRNRERRGNSAREVAYSVLRDVDERDAFANLALASRIAEARLSDQDAAFATELVAGTLRNRGLYDRIIELASSRDIGAIDAPIVDILRLATHQLIGMRTATHAAVFESVELGRAYAGHRSTGFINGVLRTITRTTTQDWRTRVTENAPDEAAAVASLTSHPEWIVRAFADALEVEGRAADLADLLESNNDSPRVQLAMLEGSSSNVLREGPSPIGAVLPSGRPAEIIALLRDEGVTARVQDQGSQLVALAMTRATPIRDGERWLDLCAGPGGKTAILAAEAKHSSANGISVHANEVAEHRAALVREAVTGFDVTVESHDGRDDAAFAGQTYDRILVDAPCTGLGALRRRPEARWRKQATDLEQLVPLQQALLASATKHLRPGGVLAYVTCSPHLAETRDVVEQHLRAFPELRQIDARAELQSVAREPLDLGDRADLTAQLWPHRHGTDAMFLALFTLDRADA